MYKKRIIYLIGNILPILVSLIVYASISQSNLYLWVGYDALIVPLYLLAFNFIQDYKAFFAWKLFVILLIEFVCSAIHMVYFKFDFSPTSTIIWLFMVGIAVAIVLVGGLALLLISKKKRSR